MHKVHRKRFARNVGRTLGPRGALSFTSGRESLDTSRADPRRGCAKGCAEAADGSPGHLFGSGYAGSGGEVEDEVLHDDAVVGAGVAEGPVGTEETLEGGRELGLGEG